LLGSAAVWPATGVAQQNNKKLIGFITGFNDKEVMPLFATFRARLQELGWIEGQNTAFDIRTTSGDMPSWIRKQTAWSRCDCCSGNS
jgi:hypothetical protein